MYTLSVTCECPVLNNTIFDITREISVLVTISVTNVAIGLNIRNAAIVYYCAKNPAYTGLTLL